MSRFTGIPEAPRWHGIYDAVVRNTDDPSGLGRVQLQVPQVMGTAMSNWAEPLSQLFGPPAIGTRVFAAFTGGDINKPVYIRQQSTTTWVIPGLTVSGSGISSVVTISNSTSSPSPILQIQAESSGDSSVGIDISGDIDNRFLIDSNGKLQWGPGNTSLDTNLYRISVNELKTDDDFTVGGLLSFGSAPAILSLSSGGYITATDGAGFTQNLSGCRFNSVTNATVSSTSQLALGFRTIPANDVENGCAYSIHASGFFTTGTTPSSATFSVFWGGLGGSNIGNLAIPTITAGLTNAGWALDAIVDWISTTNAEVKIYLKWHTGSGVSGSAEWFTVSNTTALVTSTSNNLTLAFQWGSAPGATSLGCDVVRIGRIA